MVAKLDKKTKGLTRFKRIFFQALIGIFLLGVSGFLAISVLKIIKTRGELTGKIESLKKEIQILEKENKKLETGISQTESQDYWEGKAREQGYIKEGEEAVVVLPASGEATSTQKEKSFFEKIKEKLGF